MKDIKKLIAATVGMGLYVGVAHVLTMHPAFFALGVIAAFIYLDRKNLS